MVKESQKKRQHNEEFGNEFIDMNAAKMYDYPLAHKKNPKHLAQDNCQEKSQH